jgi:hypothetical protein
MAVDIIFPGRQEGGGGGGGGKGGSLPRPSAKGASK